MEAQKIVKTVTDENFDEAIRNNGLTIIDCWAPWCSPCRMISPVIEELAEEYVEVTFGKLNVDENNATANRFRIMSIPLILFFKDGKLTDTIVGAVPKSVIEDKIHVLQ